jgi:hypothetical protein
MSTGKRRRRERGWDAAFDAAAAGLDARGVLMLARPICPTIRACRL